MSVFDFLAFLGFVVAIAAIGGVITGHVLWRRGHRDFGSQQ